MALLPRRDLLSMLVGGLAVAVAAPGCRRGRRPAIDTALDDDALQLVVESVRSAGAPFALQGRFSVHLESPGTSGTTRGALILHNPDKFRIEILTPLGTPMVMLASNGRALNAWSQRDGTFYRGDNASAVLAELTTSAVGLADVNALLTGLLPLPEAPITALAEDSDGNVRLTLQAPGDVQVRAVIDPKTELVRELRVVRVGGKTPLPGLPTGETMVEVDYLATTRIGRSRLPEQLSISLPTLGWKLELEFLSWDELGQIPDVFDLQAPGGAAEKDLVETLKKMAEDQQARGTGA